MIRLLLLDTSAVGAKGSMSRYARLVDLALNSQPGFQTGFALQILRLALPDWSIRWLPGAAQVWINHVWILLTATFRVARVSHDVLHLLDGSYGYVIEGIAKSAENKPAVATVHDLIPVLQQKSQLGTVGPSLPAQWIAERSVRGLRRCKHLIAVSGNTREDLVRLTGIDQERVSVLLNALDPKFSAAAGRDAAKAISNLAGARPVVLHIGHNGTYKNREGVLRIFSKLKANCQARLVMAGPPPTSALRDLVKALKLDDEVVFVENPEDAELFQLYHGASVFLFPSIYEGFGWPPLEAMALGCPVVCSTAASLPEVVGDAALLAPVEDENALARLCVSILNDRRLADSLIEKGRQRASQFTKERMGAQLVDVYRRVFANDGSSVA